LNPQYQGLGTRDFGYGNMDMGLKNEDFGLRQSFSELNTLDSKLVVPKQPL